MDRDKTSLRDIFLRAIMLQSGHGKSGGVHFDTSGMLHGNPVRLRNQREQSDRTGPGGRPFDPNYLHAEQIR